MSYRKSKGRFLDEYANFKKSYFTEWPKFELIDKELAAQAVEKLDNIVRNAHRGMITLDEAMRAIAAVGNNWD